MSSPETTPPETSFYELHRVVIQPPRPGEFRIATAALISCSLCGVIISITTPRQLLYVRVTPSGLIKIDEPIRHQGAL